MMMTMMIGVVFADARLDSPTGRYQRGSGWRIKRSPRWLSISVDHGRLQPGCRCLKVSGRQEMGDGQHEKPSMHRKSRHLK